MPGRKKCWWKGLRQAEEHLDKMSVVIVDKLGLPRPPRYTVIAGTAKGNADPTALYSGDRVKDVTKDDDEQKRCGLHAVHWHCTNGGGRAHV